MLLIHHWVDGNENVSIQIRNYDRLFTDPNPTGHEDKDFMEFLNRDSLKVVKGYLEPSLKKAKAGERYQFQRLGYFTVDPDTTSDRLVFNRTVPLRDTWAKIQGKK